MDPQLTKYVIASFSCPGSIAKYRTDAKKGLWDSEKIMIERYFKLGTCLLDLGCGVGRTTFPLARLGYKVTGVDVTSAFIDLANDMAHQEKLVVDIQIGDATNLEFKNNTFDNVLFSFNGWSMIPSKQGRKEAAAEIVRVLKPGGYYIFTSHIRKLFGQELLWGLQWIRLNILKPLGYKTQEMDLGDYYFNRDAEVKYSVPQFVHNPTRREVLDVMKSVGFEVVETSMRSAVSAKDANLSSGDVMFFVCRKPLAA
jgi:SAM-dependent methyltransferase